MANKTKKAPDNLVRIIKGGFDGVAIQISELRSEHERRFDTIEKKIDQTWGLIDGYVKAQEDFREEFKIMKYKMTQVEKVIKSKLGIEIE